MNFTYTDYSNLVRDLFEAGFMFCYYEDSTSVSTKRRCIMRHDVDYDLRKARSFSRFEAELKPLCGLRSYYFVLITSPFYNIHAFENRKLIKGIIKDGNKIGLHFDETQYECKNIEDTVKAVQYEKSILEDIAEERVEVVSMHRPSSAFLQANVDIPGIINSYSYEYFVRFKYLSDSRMRWRENVHEITARNDIQDLHILTHPFWYQDEVCTINDVVSEFIKRGNSDRYDALSDNITDLQSIIKRESIL